MTKYRDRTPPPPDDPVPLVFATLFAPLVPLAPLFFLLMLSSNVDGVEALLVMYAVGTGVAGALLVAAGRRGRARSLEVGLIWVFAGASAAAVFAQPTTSHFGPNFTKEIVLGAVLGAFSSTVFAVLRRLFSPSAG